MKKLAKKVEIIELEKAADESGLSFDQMMENAGRCTAAEITSIFQDLHGYNVLIMVGGGNNGGDGLVAGRYLIESGANVIFYLSHPRKMTDKNYENLLNLNCTVIEAENDKNHLQLEEELKKSDIIVDALLGTGFSPPLKGKIGLILKKVESVLSELIDKPFIVAVDCPSGLDVDTGDIESSILPADMTVTFAVAKHGFFQLPGAEMAGQVKIVDIGIPPELPEHTSLNIQIPEEEDIRGWMPARPLDAHKGTFGRLLIIAGSVNFPGAAALAGVGAYRSGAGLVTLAVPSNIQHLIAPIIPEVTWLLLAHEMGVIQENAVDVLTKKIMDYQACVIGPGLGRDNNTRDFLQKLIFIRSNQKGNIGFIHEGLNKNKQGGMLPPTVIDADGLNLMTELDDWENQIPENCILTPHPGEMARLTGLKIEDIQSARIEIAKKYSKKWSAIVVLKGAFTVIAHPEKDPVIIPLATPALARAGSGDVLAGVIGSLLAQGLTPYRAAVVGAYLHGTAGKIAFEVTGNAAGVIASDIAELIPAAINEIK